MVRILYPFLFAMDVDIQMSKGRMRRSHRDGRSLDGRIPVKLQRGSENPLRLSQRNHGRDSGSHDDLAYRISDDDGAHAVAD